jgi:hypothetical protein
MTITASSRKQCNKNVILILLMLAWFLVPENLLGQTSQNSTLNDPFLTGVFNRMHDSLKLTQIEKNNIEKAHALMTMQKMQAWQNKQDTIFIRNKLNSIEKSRDSLYREALPPEKFQKYLQLKRYILIGSKK